jgi:23S rRNA (pseudouridine1915-N3)-methyltransferase
MGASGALFGAVALAHLCPLALGAIRRTATGPFGSPRGSVRCGAQVTIHCVGKQRTSGSSEAWVDAGYAEYAKRLRVSLELLTIWHKSDAELVGAVARERARRASVVCLDERGALETSVGLSALLFEGLEAGGSRLSFVIGGADGLPAELRPGQSGLRALSLGKLTFTHQMARLVLAEQIYRGGARRRRQRARRVDRERAPWSYRARARGVCSSAIARSAARASPDCPFILLSFSSFLFAHRCANPSR